MTDSFSLKKEPQSARSRKEQNSREAMRGGASADPADSNKFTANGHGKTKSGTEPLAFRTSLDLKTRTRDALGGWFRLSPGMRVSVEINWGTRTIVEYLLSPVRKAFQEAGRER